MRTGVSVKARSCRSACFSRATMSHAVLYVGTNDAHDADRQLVAEACDETLELLHAQGSPRALRLLRERSIAVLVIGAELSVQEALELLERVQRELPDTVRCCIA